MDRYKVLQYFTWGQLSLDKDHYIFVKDLGANDVGNQRSRIYKEHYPEMNQEVATPAINSMIFLKKIEKV